MKTFIILRRVMLFIHELQNEKRRKERLSEEKRKTAFREKMNSKNTHTELNLTMEKQQNQHHTISCL